MSPVNEDVVSVNVVSDNDVSDEGKSTLVCFFLVSDVLAFSPPHPMRAPAVNAGKIILIIRAAVTRIKYLSETQTLCVICKWGV